MTTETLIAALRSDLQAFAEGDRASTRCEGCGAPLHEGDNFFQSGDVTGCWGYVLEKSAGTPCYRYRTEAGSERSWPECGEVTP